MAVDAHGTGRDVGGDGEVGQPQVLDLHLLAERFADERVESGAAEHGRHRVRQVDHLAPQLRHFLKQFRTKHCFFRLACSILDSKHQFPCIEQRRN